MPPVCTENLNPDVVVMKSARITIELMIPALVTKAWPSYWETMCRQICDGIRESLI